MSSELVTVRPETTLEECCQLMEESQIRRLPVVDAHGRCIGMIAQGDLVAHVPDQLVAELVRRVSERSETASQLAA